MFSLWRKARRENSAASRLLGSTSLRFALHGWQRRLVVDVDYVRQAMFVKFVGTHAKYDKLDLKGK
ncbi:type II toxin-antitoxin system HigB family toxin [Thiolapillus sp.]|uniref:type II toxin-antitoxin system HigB family toxin n=1 Tax=Thiolapillus sp. TaxID=2017437 RepID=UPI003AF78F22